MVIAKNEENKRCAEIYVREQTVILILRRNRSSRRGYNCGRKTQKCSHYLSRMLLKSHHHTENQCSDTLESLFD